MRIWDLHPERLCRKHLLGEHRELHGIWTILVNGTNGYALHPELKRWRGKLKALYRRHDKLVKEMERRGYRHKSKLDKRRATGQTRQRSFVHTKEEQTTILISKKCDCKVRRQK